MHFIETTCSLNKKPKTNLLQVHASFLWNIYLRLGGPKLIKPVMNYLFLNYKAIKQHHQLAMMALILVSAFSLLHIEISMFNYNFFKHQTVDGIQCLAQKFVKTLLCFGNFNNLKTK